MTQANSIKQNEIDDTSLVTKPVGSGVVPPLPAPKPPKPPKSAAPTGDRAFRALPGFVLPILYKGKIVRIRSGEATTFAWSELPYESKIHIERALTAKEIEEL